MKSFLLVGVLVAMVTFTACGGGSVGSTTPPPQTYTISVVVTGLSGGNLVLQDNGGNDLTVTTDGTFPFAGTLTSGAAYSIGVKTEPSGETCTPGSNKSGTATSNVTVTVTCSGTSYKIGGAVSGLNASGLVLQNNGGDNLTIAGNGSFTFPTPVSSGGAYKVTVLTQPGGQTCNVTNGSGTANGNVNNVQVACTNITVTINLVVSGLTASATGLVLQNNGANNFSVSANGTYPIIVNYGASYSITVLTQPAGETCTVSNGSGVATSKVSVLVTCNAITYNLSATVTGLTGTLKLQDDVGDQLTFTSNAPQTFAHAYASGSTYAVTIAAQPSGQTCTLSSNATGTITSNITVTATCTTNTVNYTLSVAVTGLSGTLSVQDNKSDGLTFTTNNTQSFAVQYASGSAYSVSISSQPSGQTCTLGTNASGTMTANTTVTAACVPNFTISVNVTGLSGTLVMQDDKSDTLNFTTNNTQTFATSYASGSSYSVSVQTQPSGQTCTLSSNASGTITANTTVTATCSNTSNGLTVSVTVTGLSGSVQMQDDQGDTLTFSNNSTKTFAKAYTSGSKYTVYVTAQPAAQACTPTYSKATITSNQTITIACATGATRALGTVSGVSSIACQGSIKNGVCQQMTVSCAGVPDVLAYVKTNAPTGTPLGTVSYNTGTDGNGLYESIFTFGSTAVQNVLNAGFTTVQISWGTPFNQNQPDGWALGPGGVLASACRYATVNQWIYNNIQANTNVPMCATANSGGAGALAYALSQYPTTLSMAEVTSGPPTGRLDWGCGCTQGKVAVQCGSSPMLGTCFGTVDAPVWDSAYDPIATTGVCTAAVNGTLPPGGLDFFLGDSVEAPGATYNLPKTHLNLVFGGADNSSAIPIGQDWFNNITSSKSQACVPGGVHSLANTLAGAQQIANDLIGMCKLQP